MMDYKDLKPTVQNMISDEAFMERIRIASETLYRDLLRISDENQDLTDYKMFKLIKYYLRSASRPSPFGLFSGISSSKREGTYKQVRVSVQWSYQVAKIAEQELPASSPLLLYKNSAIKETEEYFNVDILQNNEIRKAELKKTGFIVSLLHFLEQPRKISEIVRGFSKGEPHLADSIMRSIKRLLNEDILYTELRPGSIANSEMNEFYSFVSRCTSFVNERFRNQLNEIAASIKAYEELPVGKGSNCFFLIKEKMELIHKAKNYITVDLYIENDAPPLDNEVLNQFVQDIDFLRVFSYPQSKIWSEYINRFAQKYGYFREVPLLELLDKDFGIGLPQMKSTEDEQTGKLDHYMANLVHRALLHHQTSIKLDHRRIRNITEILAPRSFHRNTNNGFDVKFCLVEEEGQTKFFLSENSFGNTHGSFTGRFSDSIPIEYPEFEDDQYIRAELNVIPQNYADIGITYHRADYQICINVPPNEHGTSIELSDLYAGIDDDGFYLRSRKLGRKVLPVNTHLLYYRNFIELPVVIFLSEFGRYLSFTPRNFYFEGMNNWEFIPRIEYNNLILSPKRWNIVMDEMEWTLQEGKMSEEEYVDDFIKAFNVAEAVHVLNGDKTLPIYTRTALGLKLLVNELKQARLRGQSFLSLIEALEIENKSPTEYIFDYVLSVLPSPSKNASSPHVQAPVQEELPDHSWCMLSVYYREGKRIPTLLSCLDFLYGKGIEHCFAVTYIDRHEHLRLRFKADHKGLLEFKEFLKLQMNKKMLVTFNENVFFPETERYGGAEFAKWAYELFCEETKLLYEISLSGFFNHRSPREIGIILCLYTINDMFEEYESGKNFLDQIVKHNGKKHTRNYKKHRSVFYELGEEAQRLYTQLIPVSTPKRMKQRSYVLNVLNHFEEGRSRYILKSMLHMTLNRFIGIDLKLEHEIYEYASYVYYNVKPKMNLSGEQKHG
ncbi:thiopeptide-type bacteriocin biosynthesis protein [Paenibacillus caui]|uniref:thiopeptide-type bacteriocin biosynthesis protein n=1 Tax=Paenibacillus caui TaxID=2873927 RepID=UPI001CA97353|nr:thiopeptide-type bacteriocin biosynthesis protein [Paenibacillus caui]